VNAWHQLRWSFLFSLEECDLVIETLAGQRQITQPAIRMDHAAHFDRIPHERHQAFRRSIGDAPHPNATDARPILLSRNYKRLFSTIRG
jgi:hypothetical protein